MIYFGTNAAALYFGRLFVGFASGISTSVVPLYIAEISPLENRGINGSFVQLSIVIGILISAIVGIPFSTRQLWRELFAIAIIPVLIQMIMIPFVVESPFWYVMQNRNDLARASLQQVRGVEDVEQELHDIIQACRGFDLINETSSLINSMVEKPMGFRQVLNDRTLWRALIAAVGLQIIQQCSGINAAIYYSTTIFSNSYDPDMAIKLTLLISIINLASTIVSMALIDRYGRKSLLLWAEMTMSVFAFLIPIFDSLKLNPLYIVLCLLMFVFGFGLGLGSIPWLIVPEIIPGRALDVSSSICSGTNWMFNFILALVMPILIHECNIS